MMKSTSEKLAADLLWSLNTMAQPGPPPAELLALSAEKRQELDRSWERVQQKTELLFALSIGGAAWVLSHSQELDLTRWQFPGCAMLFIPSTILCVIAWWRSQKPTLILREMINSPAPIRGQERTDSSLLWNICTATALLEEQMLSATTCKQMLNKLAAVWLMVAVAIIGWIAFRSAHG